MAQQANQDRGKGLDQEKVGPGHWRIEGYDVYAGSAWEGTHTSRWAEIERDGQPVTRVGNITEARQWIRRNLDHVED